MADMREIKFRAWAGDRNTMYQDVGYIHHKVGFSILPKDSQGDDIGSMYSRSHKISIMQYTGLKDKNGVEIYEGDILKGGIYLEYEVKWDEEGNGWNINDQYYLNKFEVISNIYEHKHLLHVKDKV